MSASPKVLVIEDDPAMQATLVQALQSEHYDIRVAGDSKEGWSVFETADPDTVLLDLRLPDRSGDALFGEIRSENEDVPVIILTAFPDLRGAIALMKAGAFDYLIKPFDLTELKLSIRKALELKTLRNEVMRLKRKERRSPAVNDIVGDSAATRRLRDDIVGIAQSGSSTVLIQGDSGTGKELVAGAVHSHSPRSDGPLVAINCAAIPESLVESELFGHEKGAFTGASQTVKGVFELASGGTLFLDEIGELPSSVQPKLLRALETFRIKRVGGTREIPIDIRLVCATNLNLAELVEDGRFREDLFYRINVIPLVIPPLRDRLDDIPPLAEALVGELSLRTGLPPLRLTASAMRQLKRYPWPGNVREMRNVLERLMILRGQRAGSRPVDVPDLPEEVRVTPRSDHAPADQAAPVYTLEELERRHIESVMLRFRGNKSEVSRQLGISRNTLKDKLHKYGLV